MALSVFAHSRQLTGVGRRKPQVCAFANQRLVTTDLFSSVDLEVFEFEDWQKGQPYVCSMRSANTQSLIALGDHNGVLTLLNTRGDIRVTEFWRVHADPLWDVAFSPTDAYIAAASGDHTVSVHDSTTLSVVANYLNHSGSVKAVSFSPFTDDCLLTGGRDGKLSLIDLRAPRSVSSFETGSGITAATYVDEFSFVSCSDSDSCVRVWDSRKIGLSRAPQAANVARISLGHHGGLCSLHYNRHRSCLVVGSTASCVYALPLGVAGLGSTARRYHGHRSDGFFCKAALSPDGHSIASGSLDAALYVWQTDKPSTAPVKLCGHSREVGPVDWCSLASDVLVSAAEDSTTRVWRSHGNSAAAGQVCVTDAHGRWAHYTAVDAAASSGERSTAGDEVDTESERSYPSEHEAAAVQGGEGSAVVGGGESVPAAALRTWPASSTAGQRAPCAGDCGAPADGLVVVVAGADGAFDVRWRRDGTPCALFDSPVHAAAARRGRGRRWTQPLLTHFWTASP